MILKFFYIKIKGHRKDKIEDETMQNIEKAREQEEKKKQSKVKGEYYLTWALNGLQFRKTYVKFRKQPGKGKWMKEATSNLETGKN